MDTNLIEMFLDTLIKKTDSNGISWCTIRHTEDQFILRQISIYSIGYRAIDPLGSFYYETKSGRILVLYEISINAPKEERMPPKINLLIQPVEDADYIQIPLNRRLYRKLEDLHDSITSRYISNFLTDNQEKIISKFILNVIEETTRN